MSDFLLELINKNIKEKYINKYREELGTLNINDEFIFNEAKNKVNKLKEIFDEDYRAATDKYLPMINNRVASTRKRWVKKELETEGPFKTEMRLIEQIYKTEGMKENFKLFYGTNSLSEAIDKNINDLNSWSDNDNFLVSFKYIKNKYDYQVKIAIKNDISKIVIESIQEFQDIQNKNQVIEMPQSVSSVPFNFSFDKKLDTKKPITLNVDGVESNYFNHLYVIDDENIFQTLMGVDVMQDDTISQVIKNSMMSVLNVDDLRVFLYILSRKESNFFTERIIVLPLIDIINSVYKNNSSYYYDKCKASLYKLSNIRVGVQDKNQRGFNMGIFDYVEITSMKKGTPDMVTVTVSLPIVNDLIKRQTINLYSESLMKLEHSISQTLIFKLQSERIDHLSKYHHKIPREINLSSFRSVCFFTNKRDDRNAKKVEEALRELIENNLVIKDYERKGYNFHIKFLPFTIKEEVDLLNNDNLLIENKQIK